MPTTQGLQEPEDEGLLLPLPLELILTRLMLATQFVLSTGCNRPGLAYVLARASERLGRRALAAKLYAWALRLADCSRSRYMFNVRQLWEFRAELNRARMGRPRVVDPLFDCKLFPAPSGKVAPVRRRRAPGCFEASFTHRGLRIEGYLRPGLRRAPIELLVDGRVVARKLPLQLIPGLSIYTFGIWRDALEQMPRDAIVQVRLADGGDLLVRGHAGVRVRVPHGRGGAGGADSWRLDKKGFLVREALALEELQQGFLRIYDAVSRAFEIRLGKSLFVLYGTLLGQQRGRDFIPGDDDFDVGYFSTAKTSRAVRAEGMEIAVALARLGFVVTINRAGRLFRVRLPGMPPACHLDVHAVWEERGSLWIHPRANLACAAADFMPATEAPFRGRSVLVPARPEAFLAAYYGPTWSVPDPAYSTAARSFPAWKSRHLARSLVTPKLFSAMCSALDAAPDGPPSGGRLIATGLHPLYPLERYDRDCDW